MFHSVNFTDETKSVEKNFVRISLLKINLIFLFIAIIHFNAKAQWVNDPSINTKLAVNTNDPINISTASDQNGGAFIFWQDNKNKSLNDIYFMHVDVDGNKNFRADGKLISDVRLNKINPVSVSSQPGTAVVLWKQIIDSARSSLCLQKVSANGKLNWKDSSIQVSTNGNNILEYDAASDKKGNTIILYLTKKTGENNFDVRFQKVSALGRALIGESNNLVYTSKNRKNLPTIISDKKGGVFIFWVEDKNSKSVIYSMQVDSTLSINSGKSPTAISNTAQNVISYSASVSNNSHVYVAWQILKSNKVVYHQLISAQGKTLLRSGGEIAASLKGNQTYPQTLALDSTFILSWTNEINNDKNIYSQKFNSAGKSLWKGNGILVAGSSKDQFGQKIISDNNGGAILSWLDRRVEGKRGNIFSQKISSLGNLVWSADGVASASYDNSEKSYLSSVSDNNGGVIIFLKDKRNGKSGIYAQKIFSGGTYISQILNYKSELKNDSVLIIWNSANDKKGTSYDVQYALQTEAINSDWRTIKTFFVDSSMQSKNYKFAFMPAEQGTIQLRVVQKDKGGYVSSSKITNLNYYFGSSEIMVSQNFPNPFSDSTAITFYLPEKAKTSIEFFNSKIETISEIENKIYPAGQNKIIFYSKDLDPGIYFYRLTVHSGGARASDFVDVKKMVVTNK